MNQQLENESRLIQEVVEGNRFSFQRLYVNYIRELYTYIFLFTKSRETTEEIIQEVFIKIWECREKLKAVDSFRAYLFKAAKNKLIDHIRHEQIKLRVLDHVKRSDSDATYSLSNELAYREFYRIVQNAIETLPAKRRLIFRLHIENGLTHGEIAEQLHVSVSFVKKQLYKAVGSVRKKVAHHTDFSYTLFCIFLFGGYFMKFTNFL